MRFSGTDFLTQSDGLWPQSEEYKDLTLIAEEQRKVTHAVEVTNQNGFLEKNHFQV